MEARGFSAPTAGKRRKDKENTTRVRAVKMRPRAAARGRRKPATVRRPPSRIRAVPWPASRSSGSDHCESTASGRRDTQSATSDRESDIDAVATPSDARHAAAVRLTCSAASPWPRPTPMIRSQARTAAVASCGDARSRARQTPSAACSGQFARRRFTDRGCDELTGHWPRCTPITA